MPRGRALVRLARTPSGQIIVRVCQRDSDNHGHVRLQLHFYQKYRELPRLHLTWTLDGRSNRTENTEFSAHLAGERPANSPSACYMLGTHTVSPQHRAGPTLQAGRRRPSKVGRPSPGNTCAGAELGLALEALALEGGQGTAHSICNVPWTGEVWRGLRESS